MAVYKIPVRLTWTGASGSPGFNVWHARTGSTNDPGDDGILDGTGGPLDAIEDFYQACLGVMGYRVVINVGDGVTEITDPENPRFVEVSPRNMQAVTTNGVPSFLAICVSWRTSIARRSGMGRTFVGPIASAAQDSATGTPSDTELSTIRSAANALVAKSTSVGNWGIGVYGSSQPGNALAPKVLRDFTQSSVLDHWSYLSSRRD